jgi:AraC-like DNA-binding protein
MPLQRLTAAISRYITAHPGENPFRTGIDGLMLLWADAEQPPSHIISRPALCVVAQGAKWTSFGEERHHFHAGQALVVSLEMPSVGRITQASPAEPFLGAVIEFDLALLRDLAAAMGPALGAEPVLGGTGSCFVITLNEATIECVLRLIQLLVTPQAIPFVAPLVQRELGYWLLSSEHGPRLAQAALGGESSSRVIRAIHHLRAHYPEPLRLADLAAIARLSPSAFHRQFKAATGSTPLQYQKQLRLMEARRLMVSEATKVETAAFAVGYESASQFSREYARMFGRSPKRDAQATQTLPQVA